jgi:hypothetical protein
MASRKTYFGIGLPNDPTDPESGPVRTGGAEPEDRSAPTVVDDEKVAESLKQLRTWYQGEGPQDGAPSDTGLAPSTALPRDAIPLGGVQARPTAVGHATAPPAAAAPRPVAPDPMRATMYGHDVHRFEMEIAMAAAAVERGEQAEPAPTTTAMVLAAQAIDDRMQAVALAEPPPRSPSGSFPLAPQGEAQRLQRPGGARRTPHSTPRPTARVPLTSRIMFGAGALALAGAIVIWLQTDNASEAPIPTVRPPAPTPAPLSTPATALPREPSAQPATAADAKAVSPGILRAPTAAPGRAAPPAAARAERRPAALVTTRRQPATGVGAKVGRAADDAETADDAAATTAPETDKQGSAQDGAPLVEHPRKRVEAAPEAPPRKRSDESARTGEPQRGRVRIGTDGDETLPPSED